MAKIRVHELAKELNITSKDILGYLGAGYSAQSGLSESEVAMVRDKHDAVVRSRSLEKKAVLLKAPKKDAVKAPEKTEEPKPEKTEPEPEKKEPEKTGETKPKKPVFLFRPENSRTGLGDKLKGQTGSQKPARPGDTQKPKTLSQDGRIKPNVPTTAEQYRDMASREEEEREAKKKEKEAKAAEESVKAPETEEKKTPAAEAAGEKTAAPETETAAKTEPVKPEKTEKKEETGKKEKTEKAPASEPEKKPVDPPKEQEQKPSVKAPEKPEQTPKEKTEKPEKPAAAPAKEAKKPALTIVGKVDLNRVKESEERKKNPFQKGDNSRVHVVDNRNRDGKGDYQKGSYSKDGKPSAPGAKNNRGIFAKDGNRQGQHVHVNTAPSGDKPSGKPDTRNKKGNYKNDKDRNTFDKNGKRAENFKNLTKEQGKKQKQEQAEEVIKMIVLPETITIKDLSEKMKMKSSDLIKKLFLQGKMMTVNSELSYEDAEALALEYDILCEKEEQVDVIEELLREDEEDEKLMQKRPPVVCVMGHVDHGKTSLLDAIRKTNVISREAGGITQHIGAYMVECKGEKITFLDTPGHEAFTAMRMRGAMATDIAILVVAADDGVMPQTVEAINHAKAAGVDVIVAVNKIDKPAANVDRVKQELMEYGLVSEEWGGNTIFVPVSAKRGDNIDTLLEMILLVTEVKELKANPNRDVRGIVIEAKLDKGRGPVATVLVQKGTLRPGDFVSAGSCFGRVRAMLDADGNAMKAALPSTPVEILGLNGVPNAGEICIGHKNEKDARTYAETFIAEEKKKMLAETKHKLTLDTLFDQIQADSIKELPIILKADVQGSVEALKTSLEKLSNNEVAVRVIHGAVGSINESDVTLASASNAIVIGFNVKPDAQAKLIAEQEAVDLRLYRVIYQAIDDVEAAMKGMLAPVYEEKVLGHAEIRMIFKSSGVGNIAGSYILDGTLERGCKARITRDGETIFDGNIASLKRFKDDVKEVREGFECGIVFEKFGDIQEGDLVEGYKMVQVERA